MSADFPSTQLSELPAPLAALNLLDLPVPAPRYAPKPLRRPCPAPIVFPDPEQLTREHEARQRAERMHEAVVFGQSQRHCDELRAVRKAAYSNGYRFGFTRGTHRGIWCGAIGGSLLGMIAGVCMVKLGMWWPF